ncbi:TonB-dependent receptor plug domain-containing protein [Sphingomonas bacterium]|uniref:TonB-dependent receptor plug domain-containing protein n=1 Tax=Sphingomonas bacterium TaxID=1895847 RepID=UPI001576099E|nr:TonB-dependent receptor plug domain-containing protein [Sphingomonas bacterium]
MNRFRRGSAPTISALAVAGASAAILCAGPANAQSTAPNAAQASTDAPRNPGDGIADIVVTAQRREERLQDVPIAVSAITGATLAKAGVAVSTDLAQSVSGVTITDNAGYVQPRIRGIGNNVIGVGYEGGVATYIDGVYIGSAPASLLSLSGVERVEVLKGPQGTLFGRNSTGGLIQVVTREPSQHAGGQISLGYANYGTVSADAYVTGGLTDTLSADFAGHSLAMQDGYGVNVHNGAVSLMRTGLHTMQVGLWA